ncbi:hypothetical protein L2E82_25721 [Cichorium intybus]|uniref:Uncharacterized protein n=1 Tax=Cichorium intybus TaxID=13427 RepID=A0ACB9E4F0_CICIN|nr:hypothetical protein L2E82_25721 [Cichorium intybus]
MDVRLEIPAYANALTIVSVIDELNPAQVLNLLLDSRNSCVSHKLASCGKEIVNKVNGRYLIDAIDNGQQLSTAEKLIGETMEWNVLLGSLEWLKIVFGLEIEMSWNRIYELVLGNGDDIWDENFE